MKRKKDLIAFLKDNYCMINSLMCKEESRKFNHDVVGILLKGIEEELRVEELRVGGIKMNSFKDSSGNLWVACSECNRGGNGNDPDKCSCGGRCKKFNGTGCFNGYLMEKYKEEV